jgi:hypothetical protein
MDPDIRSRLSTALLVVLALALLGLLLLRSVAGTARDGLTIDEPYHYAAGVYYQRHGDYRLNPEHPPLAKRWVGWWAPAGVATPPLRELREKDDERVFVQTMAFLDNPPAQTQAAIRHGMFAFNLLLLGLLTAVVWRVAGAWWALGMLAFLAVDPTVGAHLPVLMTDLPLTLALGLAAATAAWLAMRWRWAAAVAFGIAAGLALGAKHSALPGLIGIGVLLLGVALWPDRQRQSATRTGARLGRLAAAVLLAVAVLWASYGFQYHATRQGSDPFNKPFQAKIDDLSSPTQRAVLHAVDRMHLLPRPYLWGLADTLRTGVEGRGQDNFWLFGTKYKHAAPWFFWPGMIAAKLPLALWLAVAGGLLALWRAPLQRGQRLLLATMAVLALAHLAALLSSNGTWGGIRHALPLYVPLATLAGVLTWRVSRSPRRRWLLPLAAAPAAIALAMTFGEPRLWEYWTEPAGGAERGFANFSDEGVDLGQRLPEIGAALKPYIARDIPIYNSYISQPEWAKAEQVPLRRFASGLDDTNVGGHYGGVFVMGMGATIPEPEYDYDPKQMLRNLRLVQRIGTAGIWVGRMDDARLHARGMFRHILDEVYKNPHPDWRKVAARCDEMLKLMPFATGCAVESGNAWARLGEVSRARAAWSGGVKYLPPNDPVARQLDGLVASTAGGTLPADWKPARDPWIE